MIDHIVPARLAEPPPSFDLVLLDGDTRIGFISPTAIGFSGFASETEAAHAAWAAHRQLSWRRAVREGSRPMPVDIEPLMLRHGDPIQVEASGKAFAELRAPMDGRAGPCRLARVEGARRSSARRPPAGAPARVVARAAA